MNIPHSGLGINIHIRLCTYTMSNVYFKSIIALVATWMVIYWWNSCVLHVAVHARCTQSTRPPHSTSGRWRHQAGAEQAALSTELHCRVRHSHPTLSSLDRQEEHHRAHTRLACGGAGHRWFFLRQSWLGSSPLTQRNHSPPPSRQPPPSPRFVTAISVAHGAMHYRH